MNRKIIIGLIYLVGLAIIVTFLLLAFYEPKRSANSEFAELSSVSAVRLDYVNVAKSRSQAAALEQQLKAAKVSMVSLGAGRVDWTYFPWRDHQERWSDDVRSTGIDYMLEDSIKYGKWTHVSAVVDVLAPLYVQAHPEIAAISYTGKKSKDLVSLTELVDGSFGQDLLDMIDTIATYYPVNSITLAELNYFVDGYGEQDKASFMEFSTLSDWPRTPEGEIDIENPAIGIWRSYMIERFLNEAAALVHQQGKLFFLEEKIGIESENKVFIYNGSDFNLFLVYADRLIIRSSSEPISRSPEAISAIAQYLAHYQKGRIILNLGLWEKDYEPGTAKILMSSITAEDLKAGLRSAFHGGVTDLMVSPSFLMQDSHWQVLTEFWARNPVEVLSMGAEPNRATFASGLNLQPALFSRNNY